MTLAPRKCPKCKRKLREATIKGHQALICKCGYRCWIVPKKNTRIVPFGGWGVTMTPTDEFG